MRNLNKVELAARNLLAEIERSIKENPSETISTDNNGISWGVINAASALKFALAESDATLNTDLDLMMKLYGNNSSN